MEWMALIKTAGARARTGAGRPAGVLHAVDAFGAGFAPNEGARTTHSSVDVDGWRQRARKLHVKEDNPPSCACTSEPPRT